MRTATRTGMALSLMLEAEEALLRGGQTSYERDGGGCPLHSHADKEVDKDEDDLYDHEQVHFHQVQQRLGRERGRGGRWRC